MFCSYFLSYYCCLLFVYCVFFFGIYVSCFLFFFFFQAEDGIRDTSVTGVQTCALPIFGRDEVSDRMGPNNIVMGWTPDGKNVLFRSRMRSFNDFIGQLYTVPAEGGMPEPLPLPRGGFAS